MQLEESFIEKTKEIGSKVGKHVRRNWKKYALGAAVAGAAYGGNKLFGKSKTPLDSSVAGKVSLKTSTKETPIAGKASFGGAKKQESTPIAGKASFGGAKKQESTPNAGKTPTKTPVLDRLTDIKGHTSQAIDTDNTNKFRIRSEYKHSSSRATL